MKALAVITARGGSKRIPDKNIRPFCGRPILTYSIEAAQNSGLFEEVMVSTDSKRIAGIAEAAHASVPFLRSEKNSDDHATTAQVLLEVLEEYEQRGRRFDAVCCLYPTAPFITPDKLRAAFRVMEESCVDAVVPIVRFSFPPQRGLLLKDGAIRYQYPEYENARSQDLQAVYHDCGQFYWCRVAPLRKYKSLIVPNTAGFVVSEEEVQDIDNLSDWRIAEMKFRCMKEGIANHATV